MMKGELQSHFIIELNVDLYDLDYVNEYEEE